MKNLASKMMICCLLTIGIPQAKADLGESYKTSLAWASAIPMATVACTKLVMGQSSETAGLECLLVGAVATFELQITMSLLKEMHEVSPDAANYVATGDASLVLQSVVEKFQETAAGQGKDLSFDEVVDVINTMEMKAQ